jgi:hypothetical protein
LYHVHVITPLEVECKPHSMKFISFIAFYFHWIYHFLIMIWKKKCRKKKHKNNLRRNDYEACTAVAHCFPNILDVNMVLENINVS